MSYKVVTLNPLRSRPEVDPTSGAGVTSRRHWPLVSMDVTLPAGGEVIMYQGVIFKFLLSTRGEYFRVGVLSDPGAETQSLL